MSQVAALSAQAKLLGVVIGPHGLGWATPTRGVPYRAQFGMAFLFFLAGVEIDLLAIRDKLRAALVGWLLGFGVAVLLALWMHALGLMHAWQVVAIAIATSSWTRWAMAFWCRCSSSPAA